MRALIDGDIVNYRIGFTTNNEPLWIAHARCNEMIEGILRDTQATSYNIYISDDKENCFRSDIYPEYKANRKQPKPLWYNELKEYLIVKWNAQITVHLEADDKLGIEQDKRYPLTSSQDTIICSIDKDLFQIPGRHYNFVKKEFRSITPTEGERFFWKQVLTGDAVDNIPGAWMIGPVTADYVLDHHDYLDWFSIVLKVYKQQYNKYFPEMGKEDILERLRLMGRLVRIMQHEDEELWDFPCRMALVDQIWSSSDIIQYPRRGKTQDTRVVPQS